MLQLAPRYYLAKGKGCQPSLRVRVAFCGVVLPRHALHTPILSLSLPHQRRHSLALVNEWPKPPRLLHHLTWLCHGSTQDLFKLWYHNTTTHARTHGHNDATTKETTQQRKQRRNNATTQQRNNATTNATTQQRNDERNDERNDATTQRRTQRHNYARTNATNANNVTTQQRNNVRRAEATFEFSPPGRRQNHFSLPCPRPKDLTHTYTHGHGQKRCHTSHHTTHRTL